jgi:predicted RNase H-like HicB family nuclease
MSVTYTVLVYENEPDEQPGYWASVAELPGCFTHGASVDEIRESVKDAIEAYFEAVEASGADKPQPVAQKLEVVVG